ncbi:epoxide hydrolase [Actinoplanes sp. SE50]|uniref:alpha/beta fold hydrolase n=1 Tax=unclassified Actinoplanes TaxID=2626549 RepID=UPI00023EC4FF|nr:MULTISPECIES: alpha/beta hydrolase [unclassified Actinoplanes]AEV87028.1 epoxide hydrolase [Actinoplanes sp. SE50/110]ATO85426.1 epoxide hydrolase [Actinoplanes sp. SE50]SLM02838.1 epoxide hydrolase [Actinoplanes sp. SE50/110]
MIEHHDVALSGVRLHVAEQGTGPLVVLLHGFPEFWYSWRHQLAGLAAAGYRVVAPDQRGYGRSDRPADVEAYTLPQLAGDVVGLIRALGEKQAFVVGHDWGALVAWAVATMRPDMVRAVAGVSVPPLAPRGPQPPLLAARERFGGRFYWNYFETPGVAEAEFGKDLGTTFRRMLFGASGSRPADAGPVAPLVPPGGGFLDLAPEPPVTLPPWLTEADIAAYVEAFTGSGFTGGLNWYRNLDRNWELTAVYDGAVITVPALFVIGERDKAFTGVAAMDAAVAALAPGHRGTVVVPGAGHWVQQESPEHVTGILREFLATA